MNEISVSSADRAAEAAPAQGEAFVPAQPLERRRLQAYLTQMLGDILAIFAGFGLSGYLYLGRHGLEQAGLLAQLLLPVFLTVALYNGAYSLSTLRSARTGTLRALGALAISATAVVFITFYTKSSAEFSRVLFTAGVMMAGLALIWTRLQLRAFVRWRCGDRLINELLIDDGGPAVDLPGVPCIDARAMALVPALDNPAELNRIGAVLHAIDRVVVTCPPERRAAWARLLKGASIDGEVIDPTVAELGAHGARAVGGQGFLRVSIGPLGLRARAAKRLFDLTLAGGGLLVLSPLLLIVAIAILVEDGSPILFLQRRVGRSNRFFNMYKFRSMRAAHSDGLGEQSTSRDDDRVTRVGRFIRRTSIDELPQLINVLKGEMSMVGPRPHALGSQAGEKLFWEVDDRYWERHALKPGLTGLAQIRGLRGATEREEDLAERLESDLEYLDGWSLWRDLRIVLGTIRVLAHDRAF
ncbi:sugar transferase [Novosphingobium sp.]|uniref:sugar transferase n=1 Tax=Novosphingobium sp. TaxID=1874826 RepID=UPI0025E9BCBD|nr:sugar transferase [Novosphingobium sp.]MCC6926664.1 sugar transferase [Novosphingobium sp.]